jgi:hypothetical protein
MTAFAPAAPAISIEHAPLMGDGPRAFYLRWDAELVRSREPTGRWVEILAALFGATESARQSNWDGFHASAVNQDSIEKAITLLALLPEAFPAPAIGVDADGEVSLEWDGAQGAIFGVSVSSAGELRYAGVFGQSRVRGREPLGTHLPAALLANLQRLYDNGAYRHA